jgi:uncharacterized protein (TIGR02001 family)
MGRSRYLLVALGLAASQGAVAADFSANIGMMSDYIFRGIKQNTSAAAFAGLDYENSGFYVGTWAAEVGEGLEYDLYAGYEGSVGDFSYGIGYTGYFYTDDFDDTYNEINLTPATASSASSTPRAATTTSTGRHSTTASWPARSSTRASTPPTAPSPRTSTADYVEVGYGTEVSGFDLASRRSQRQ